MDIFPRSFQRFLPNMLSAFVTPAFFFLALLLYEPQPLSALLRTGEMNILIAAAIIFVSVLLLRILFFLLRDTLKMSIARYALWCAAEIVIASALVAFYFSLISRTGEPYSCFFGRTLGSLAPVLIIPYLIITLAYGWYDAANVERKCDEAAFLRFYDSRHLLKFRTEAGSVLYIEANENYVIIHYLENGIEKKYQIRCSMKSLESLCDKAGFARVHRCYYLNPVYVKTVRKDEEGVYYADLGAASDTEIPVSKKYYSNLVALL